MGKKNKTRKNMKNIKITKKHNKIIQNIIDKEVSNLNNNINFSYKMRILDKFINNNNNKHTIKKVPRQ